MNVTQRLTWRDMFEIYNIARLYFRELDEGPAENFPDSTREMYEEVLRRYEERKGGGGRNLSADIAQDHAPGHATTKSDFRG